MKGWRTLLINLAIGVGGVLVAVNWSDVLPTQDAWIGVAIVGAINMGLRYITTTPIGKASP